MNALIQLCELLIVLIKRIDLIDLPFLALAIATQRPAFLLAFVLQAIARRWPLVCRGALLWCRVATVQPWHCKVLPGAAVYLMSNEEDEELVLSGSGTGSDEVVLGQQHQVVPEEPLVFESVLNYLERQKFTDEQVIDLFTVIQREKGYVLSANKIREAVGGNEAAVKARVAKRRPKAEQPQPPRTMGQSGRPQRGW